MAKKKKLDDTKQIRDSLFHLLFHGLELKGGSLGKYPNLGCFSFGRILVMGGQGFLWSGGSGGSGGSGNSGNGGGSGLVTTGGS